MHPLHIALEFAGQSPDGAWADMLQAFNQFPALGADDREELGGGAEGEDGGLGLAGEPRLFAARG